MQAKIEVLKKFLPPDTIKRLELRKFSQGEIIPTTGKDELLYLQKGMVIGVSYYEDQEYFFPHKFKPGEILGLGKVLFLETHWWDFIAATEVEAILFPEDIVKNYLLDNFTAYKYLVKVGARINEKFIRSFYIQAQGGARALFAYILVENSIDGVVQYLKHNNLANVLSISRTRLHKLEKEFVEKGLIRKEKKRIIILNSEGLKDFYKDIFTY